MVSQTIDYQTLVVVSTVSAFIGALVAEVARVLIKEARQRAKQAATALKTRVQNHNEEN